jgi:tripartite-type tricarboxylate transporter receptor subunit TctC
MRRRFHALATAACVALAGWTALMSGGAHAQSKIDQPVTIIVPYAPGAATDALGRLLAEELKEKLGVSVIVENRGGGGSQIGTLAIASAEPNGQTLGFVDTAFAINPGLLGAELPYNTPDDFTPISLMATAQMVLVVHPSVEAKTMEELVALAKANPKSLAYGSAGVGSAPHLAGEQLRHAAAIDITHIPYQGGGTVITDLLGGHIQFGFFTVATMRKHIEAGSVRALAVTGRERSSLIPGVPSMSEAGLGDVDATPFFGLIGPKNLPEGIVAQLSDVTSTAVRSGTLKERVAAAGFVPVGTTGAEFGPWLSKEIAKWSEVIKRAGIDPKS